LTVNSLQDWIAKHEPLFDVLLDAYCIVDKTNKVVHFNTAFTDLCGESYRKILKIGNFCDLIKTVYCPDMCPAKQVLSTASALRLDEIAASSKAFPQLTTILSAITARADSGEILGALITIRNVTAESELQKKYNQRTQESVTDGLTNLYNKTFTENSLRRAIKSNSRDMKGVSVIMIDLDHFKHVNDIHGHQAGDHVLSIVAKLVQQATRETDIVGRFGGEEFLVVLTNSDQSGALIFAERFRNQLEKTGIVFGGTKIPITASVGTASFTERRPNAFFPNLDEIVQDLVKNADTALYYSKANGRNRTTQYEDLQAKQNTEPAKKAA
jgi:diguanylate cyclase (GGDEF)-like protein